MTMHAIDPDGMERARARQARRIQDAIDEDRPDRLLRRMQALKRREQRKTLRTLGLCVLALASATGGFWLLVWAISEERL